MRIVEVIAPERHRKELVGMGRFYGAVDVWWGASDDAGRQAVRMLVPDAARQQLMDALQNLLDREPAARLVVQSVDATAPRVEPEDGDEDEDKEKQQVRATREELYTQIAAGSLLDGNYLLLVVLSTVVAFVGLSEDNVAVVIGAMVIAPLLGPIIAFAFATSLGDRRLAGRSFLTGLTGLGVATLLSLAIALVLPVDLASHEIMVRTDVALASVALALASGAAAVLSLTTGLSTTLVGVMVAVALLPPTVVLGMLLGNARWELAMNAALLLAVNVVCVLLAAMVVFLARGVKPRTWLEQTKVKQSRTLYIALWTVLLAVLIAAIVLRGSLL